jgi:hypothetical protein
MEADCDRFQRAYGNVIDAAETPDSSETKKQERAGADFWFTRNRHGAGFWDGDWSDPQAKTLTDAAHRFGEFDLLEGDDGEIDCYPYPNPLGLSGTEIALAAGGVLVVGVIGYLIYRSTQPAAGAAGTAGTLSAADAANAASIGLTPQEYIAAGLVGSAAGS